MDLGKYRLVYEDTPSQSPTLCIWENNNIDEFRTLRIRPRFNRVLRIIDVFVEYVSPDEAVIYIPSSFHDSSGFLSICVNQYSILSLSYIREYDPAFSASRFNNLNFLGICGVVYSSESPSRWNFEFYDTRKNKFVPDKSEEVQPLVSFEHPTIMKSIFDSAGITIISERNAKAYPDSNGSGHFDTIFDWDSIRGSSHQV